MQVPHLPTTGVPVGICITPCSVSIVITISAVTVIVAIATNCVSIVVTISAVTVIVAVATNCVSIVVTAGAIAIGIRIAATIGISFTNWNDAHQKHNAYRLEHTILRSV